MLKWVDWTVSEPRYFQLQTDHTPVHLALLDEISTCHQLLHPQVLQLLVKLFETEHSQLDVMEQVSCTPGFLHAGRAAALTCSCSLSFHSSS